MLKRVLIALTLMLAAGIAASLLSENLPRTPPDYRFQMEPCTELGHYAYYAMLARQAGTSRDDMIAAMHHARTKPGADPQLVQTLTDYGTAVINAAHAVDRVPDAEAAAAIFSASVEAECRR